MQSNTVGVQVEEKTIHRELANASIASSIQSLTSRNRVEEKNASLQRQVMAVSQPRLSRQHPSVVKKRRDLSLGSKILLGGLAAAGGLVAGIGSLYFLNSSGDKEKVSRALNLHRPTIGKAYFQNDICLSDAKDTTQRVIAGKAMQKLESATGIENTNAISNTSNPDEFFARIASECRQTDYPTNIDDYELMNRLNQEASKQHNVPQ